MSTIYKLKYCVTYFMLHIWTLFLYLAFDIYYILKIIYKKHILYTCLYFYVLTILYELGLFFNFFYKFIYDWILLYFEEYIWQYQSSHIQSLISFNYNKYFNKILYMNFDIIICIPQNIKIPSHIYILYYLYIYIWGIYYITI